MLNNPIKNHEMCCGNGCDKKQLASDFESMESQINALRHEVSHLNDVINGMNDTRAVLGQLIYSERVVGKNERR